MDNTINICSSCGKILQPGEICIDCTVTDLRISDAITTNKARSLSQPVKVPFKAYLTEQSAQNHIPIPGPKSKIGRDPTNQIVINNDQYASRFHAWITYEEGHFFIEDLGSTNGTLLNGSPLINRRPLINGDLVRIGRTEYMFHIENTGLAGKSSQSSQSA